jgi:hypothetical protein
MFADASTRNVKVGKEITDALTSDLRSWVAQRSAAGDVEETVQDLLVEAAAVTATYNMVSRFLISLDVGCMSDNEVPWPVDRKEVRSLVLISRKYLVKSTTAFCHHPWT